MNEDTDSRINPTSVQDDVREGMAMARKAIDARLEDMVNTAMMNEQTVIDCFDMDKPYFNAAVCKIAKLIACSIKRVAAGLANPDANTINTTIGDLVIVAIYNDLREAAEDSI